MLPATFTIPGKPFKYVDLRTLFEINGIPGRFRDWMRRKVIPLLGEEAIQYNRKDTRGNSRDFCVAEPNAISLLAMAKVVEVQDLKDKIVPLPRIPYTHSHVVFLPFHGFSTNKMYEPHPNPTPKQKLTKTQGYRDWINQAKEALGPRPTWFDKKKTTHINFEFSMRRGSDCDNLIKSFQDSIFQHSWGRTDNSVKSHFVQADNTQGYYCKATIYQ